MGVNLNWRRGVNLAGFYTTINGTEILKKKINNFPKNIALKNLAKEKLQAEILSEILFFPIGGLLKN